MKTKTNVPYSVVTEGALAYFKEDVPLWLIMLLIRIHHFNSRREERYTLYLEKDAIKLKIPPEILLKTLEELRLMGQIEMEKANSGLYLITLNDEIRKNIDLYC
jgi:hypothetical protein